MDICCIFSLNFFFLIEKATVSFFGVLRWHSMCVCVSSIAVSEFNVHYV